MDLALIWAGIIAFAVLVYVMLDGFDLGVGMLFLGLDSEQKDHAIHSIAPIWDGNETWLVLGGGGLFAVFPLAYATILPALYAPVIAMLLALIFRGVSMEYRHKTVRWHKFWNLGFFVGSSVASFAQGVMLGAFIQGIDIQDRQYAGGWFDWLTPFSVACGVAVVLGYRLLGAAWILMKTRGALALQMRQRLPGLAVAAVVAIVVISSWTGLVNERLTERWFSWPNFLWLAPIPMLVAITTLGLWHGIRRGGDAAPFAWALALFGVTFAGFGISTYPYIVPHSLTIWEAAAPDVSLSFLLVGSAFLIPLILVYTAHTYWVFRGKVEDHQVGYD